MKKKLVALVLGFSMIVNLYTPVMAASVAKPMTLNEVTTTTIALTGKAIAGNKLVASVGNKIYKGTVNKSGNYAITIPRQKKNVEVIVKSYNKSGVLKEAVGKGIVTESQFKITKLTSGFNVLTGKAPANAKVKIKVGGISFTVTANSKGVFKKDLPNYQISQEISVYLLNSGKRAVKKVTKKTIAYDLNIHGYDDTIKNKVTYPEGPGEPIGEQKESGGGKGGDGDSSGGSFV